MLQPGGSSSRPPPFQASDLTAQQSGSRRGLTWARPDPTCKFHASCAHAIIGHQKREKQRDARKNWKEWLGSAVDLAWIQVPVITCVYDLNNNSDGRTLPPFFFCCCCCLCERNGPVRVKNWT